MIIKAIKYGVEIYYGLSDSILVDFVKIYNETMDRDNVNEYYYFNEMFYDSLAELIDNYICFYAKNNRDVIASSLFLLKYKKMYYHLSVSKIVFMKLAPSNLLLNDAANW